MAGISWLAFTYANTGEIYTITGVPGIFPSDGAFVDPDDTQIVRHIMRDDLETLGFQDPAQFMVENYWSEGAWVHRGSRPTDWYKWNDAWVVNTEELLVEVRRQRNFKLGLSDWTQSPDSPLSDSKKAEWQTYRQSLRDIIPNLPSNLDDPNNVSWPTEPS
jgi:hypothetical protein